MRLSLCVSFSSSCLQHELQLWRALQVGPWFHCMFSILFVFVVFPYTSTDPSQISIWYLLINHTFPNPQARFWVQVIDELRRGVRLKKSNHERTPIEYELTPYEILMGDIRAK